MTAVHDLTARYAPLAGRILMSLLFLVSVFGKLTDFGGTAGAMAGKGMPMPQLLLVAGIALELAGSIMLILGWKVRLAALALIVFTIPATLYFHNFWAYPPEQVRNQRNHFLKNVTIVGGLVFVIGMGAGPLALDNRRRLQPTRGV